MGRRGPPPKPTILKLVAGNPGRRELNELEPIPPAGDGIAPPFLAEFPGAVALWNRLVPDLVKSKLATSVDWPVLARYCIKLDRWIFLAREIERAKKASPLSRGSLYPSFDYFNEKSEDGTTVVRKKKLRALVEFPWVHEWRLLDRELRADEQRIGISASARSRIQVPGGEKTETDKRKEYFTNRGTAG